MQEKKTSPYFSRLSGMFENAASVKEPTPEMRQLNDEELRVVAGGPEVEVGNGN